MNAATNPPCSNTEITNPPDRRGSRASINTLLDLLRFRHQSHLIHPRRIHDRDEPHDQPIWDALIRPEIHAAVGPGCSHRPERDTKLVEAVQLLVVDADLSGSIHRYDQAAIRFERLC